MTYSCVNLFTMWSTESALDIISCISQIERPVHKFGEFSRFCVFCRNRCSRFRGLGQTIWQFARKLVPVPSGRRLLFLEMELVFSLFLFSFCFCAVGTIFRTFT